MAVANSLEQMKKQSSDDSINTERGMFSVDIDQLKEEEGFNPRDYNDPNTEKHIENLAQAYTSGDIMPPPLMVKVVDGEILVRDGHCRLRGAKLARERGADVRRLQVIEFKGDEIDQTALILTSNSGKKLTQLEAAKVFQKMKNLGLNEAKIGAKVGISGQRVRQMLALIDLPVEYKQLINEEKVSPTLAAEVYNAEGTKGASRLAKVYQEMTAKMSPEEIAKKKPKVTPKQLNKKPRLPAAVVTSMRTSFSSLAPLLADLDISEDQEKVSIDLDRETFLRLKEDVIRVKKAEAEAEESAAAAAAELKASLEEEERAEKEAAEAQAAQEEAERAEARNKALAEANAKAEAEMAASQSQSEEAPSSEEASYELSNDDNELDSESLLSEISSLTGSSADADNEEEDGDWTVVRDEDEEHMGMHNTPDY